MIKDIDIRKEMYRTILRAYDGQKATRIVAELGLCQGEVRVDIAVVNGSLIGYEIKSESDTLRRLPGQLEIYNKTLDYVTVVTHADHLDDLRTSIPDWWGVIEVRKQGGRLHFIHIRKARKNKNKDPYSLAQLLWKDETIEVLESLGICHGLKSKPRAVLWKKLTESVPINQLSQIVRAKIISRQNWRVD